MHRTAAKLRQRLLDRGLDVEVRILGESARTANEAAEVVGCEVGQIVKALVFVRDEVPVMVLCAGRPVAETVRHVWCAAGTPHAVFEVGAEALIGAIGRATVVEVAVVGRPLPGSRL